MKHHMRKVCLTLLLATLFLATAHAIRPTQPIKANPNTESSPANFFFYFAVEEQVPASAYLMITFTPYITTADPISCDMLSHSANPIIKCVNLNTAGSEITITQSGINEVNPNIESTKTIVMQFTSGLQPDTEYAIQITTNNVLPDIGSITSSFEFYTVTNTGVMIEENWNCGQVFLEPKQNRALSVLSRNSMQFNLPGTSFTDLLFDIQIGVDSPTPLSRLKFVVEGGFTFTDSSLVNTQALVGAAPVILSNVVESPNVIITTFNESFVDGRQFSLTIADIKNPLYISSGYISVYHIPYNSLSPLEISEQSIPIKTIPFTPTITLLTIDGTIPSAPIQYYTSTIQYIRMTIIIPRDISPDYVIQIESDTLVFHEGSVFAKTSTVEADEVNYEHYAANGVRISGFPLIPDSSTITVSMRVEISSTPIFTMTVKVDEVANLADPIIEGTVSSNSAAIPESYISLLTGNSGEANKITSMQSSTSSLSFTVTPNFLTNAGSSIKIITSSKMISSSFNSATSCIVNGSAEACSLTTNTSFTTITIASNSSHNLFPQAVDTTVVINNVAFNFASSHSEHIYHFYFSLTISQAVNAAAKNLLKVPFVIPERERMTSFANYFSNDMNNTGTNFPNIFRLVSSSTAQWQNVIQAYERRIISVFAYQGWTNLFSVSNGESYPAKSNIAGFTYTYRVGTSSSRTVEYPIDWDRIDIVLDGSETSTDFSIIIPTTFISNAALLFEVLVGVINIETRVIQYLNVEPEPVNGNPTYLMAAAATLSSKPKITTNKIDLAGEAGSYADQVEIVITPGNPSFSATDYASALIIVSDWKIFDDTSSFNAATLGSSDPSFAYVEQSPLWLYMPNQQKYLTYIPIGTAAAYPAQFSIFLDSVKLPYSHDLPYYSIYLIDESGTIDCFNELINEDKGVFYESYLSSLTFNCNVNTRGVLNTFCTLSFVPNHDLEIGSTLRVYFTGMQVSTDLCLMVHNPNTSISVSCQSTNDKNELQLTMGNEARLPHSETYTVEMYGIAILDSTIIHYVIVELRDPTASYIVEQGTRILLTSVPDFRPVYITEISYSKNNPIIFSSFNIKFELPRQLNDDESFAIVLSNDLTNLNTIFSKLNVKLFDSDGNRISAIWTLNLKYNQILFEGLNDVLTASEYSVQIHGIKTPSTIEQDLISVIYLRNYDLSYTVYNNEESTQEFPSLSDKVNSLITMQPNFNTEGLEQQLTFTIVNQYSPVTPQTQWIINLPRYYSEHLWNNEYLIYCKIEASKIDCERDANTPYQIVVKNSPRIIEVGETYELKVYGIPCPRASYLNGNAEYVTESIFLGISETSSSESFIEYSELFLVETVINPENEPGYGSVIVTGIQSSNMEVRQATFFIITATCSVAVADGDWIYITFPEEFDNFNDLGLTVEVAQGAVDETFTAEVVNRRIGFQLNGMSLTADTDFNLQISSLPIPSNPVEIDMNKLNIFIATSNQLGTKASSIQRHNLVGEIEFLPSELHIVINNYVTIPVTAGTYSLPIKIQPSDFSTFVSNMKITFVSDALSFKTSPSYIYLGQQFSTFSVGADQSLIPTIYAFDIIKTESSISAFYTSLTKYTVEVSNVPVPITIPSSVSVPEGGCSVPFQIELDNFPYSDVNINFEYDTELYNLHLFWVNEEIAYNELEFDSTITKRWLSFCADSNIGLSSVDVKLFLGGTNYQAYQLSSESISVSIINNSTTNVSPTFTLEDKNLQKTYAGFDVTANIPGQIFYELKLAPLSSPLSLVDLKTNVKEYEHNIESQTDYLNHIYLDERDHRVGMRSAVAGVNALEFDDLLPGESYTLCVYFENQHREVADRICQTFSTMDWGVISRASITFTDELYNNQLNKILCFFVKSSESQINQVIDLDGHSCSLNSAPQNYNYMYPGETISSEKQSTLIYFITNRNLTTDPSVALFSSNYDSDGITAPSLSFALSAFAINYIDSSYLQTTFDPSHALSASSSFRPTFSSNDASYSKSSKTITVSRLKLSRPGSVYFILTFNKRIKYNEITGSVDIEIRSAVTPNNEQILNCMDAYGETPLDCKRVVLKSGEYQSITFSGIEENSVYVIYYGVANEYPLRPVMVSSVQNITVMTVWECFPAFTVLLGLFLAMLM